MNVYGFTRFYCLCLSISQGSLIQSFNYGILAFAIVLPEKLALIHNWFCRVR